MKFSRIFNILLINVFFVSCVNDSKTLNQNTDVEYFKSGDFFYQVSEGNDSNDKLIADTSGVRYEGLQGELVIPAGVEYNSRHYDVISVDDSIFAGNEKLTSLIISDGIKHIGNNTFSGCTSLSYVRLPNGLISMGSRAFSECEQLQSITLPGSLNELKKSTFFGCLALENITIPDNFTKIGRGADRKSVV